MSPFKPVADQSGHVSLAEKLNGDGHSGLLDCAALQRAMYAQGSEWHQRVTEQCPHLFSDVALFIGDAHLQQMKAVVAAVERVVNLPAWNESREFPHPQSLPRRERGEALGVFFGYDFHINREGTHLIEINTNAGGGFLSALLFDSQRNTMLPGAPVVEENPEQAFLDMFRNEWSLVHGDAPLATVAIVDEQPEAQYLYPEFLLAQRMFERTGISAYITDPAALHLRGDGLYLELPGGEQKIDLVYNRLTDFSLQRYPALHQACLEGNAVITPAPAHYVRYADKRNLVRLSDADALGAVGADEADISTLVACVPQARLVEQAHHEQWWQERRQWFFKPNTGYGSKGSYSGAKLTRRVFDEIMQGGYVAQRIAAPGERIVCPAGMEPQALKYDVRCYVYCGRVQLVAARLYQGQTTNFRTPGGGFAPVYRVK